MLSLIKELYAFMKSHKKLWLFPLVLLLLLIGGLLIVAQGSVFAPLIYTLF